MKPSREAHKLAIALFEAECGIPPNSLTFSMSLWKDRVEFAQKVLDIPHGDVARAEQGGGILGGEDVLAAAQQQIGQVSGSKSRHQQFAYCDAESHIILNRDH